MPKAGGGRPGDPKSGARSCLEQLSSLSTFCQGTAWPQAPHSPERRRCQPPPAPGTCPTSLITDSRRAVCSLIERPWGEGAAETVIPGRRHCYSFAEHGNSPLTRSCPRGALPGAEETAASSSLNPSLLSPPSLSPPCPSTVTSACSSHRPFHHPAEHPPGLSRLLSVPTGLRLGLPLFLPR